LNVGRYHVKAAGYQSLGNTLSALYAYIPFDADTAGQYRYF
jgi:hypothetical protein